LAARWGSHGVALLTCSDLSLAGWRHAPNNVQMSQAVIAGQLVPAEKITGVFTRLPCVYEQELGHIAPADRAYVAAEMTAFLTAWLSALPCPVLNRPTPTCLSGLNWRPEQWDHAAADLGIPVRTVRREVAQPAGVLPRTPGRPQATVTIVGHRWFGAVHDTLTAYARRLAVRAGVKLLA